MSDILKTVNCLVCVIMITAMLFARVELFLEEL